ncbi:MAG TPA: glucose-1-phosphate adenylyltransferase [Candidatus Binatia bacterium]
MAATSRRILGMIMAGGEGTRLYPLTRDRAKPAVPFGGKYRLIDFVLSNFVNSGIYSIYVMVQFKSQSLIEHLAAGWKFGGLISEHFISPVPAQMRLGHDWYRGTADAIYQNLNLIENFRPDLVAVFGADHIYRMDIQQMADFHQQREAQVTVATLPVPRHEASSFGIVEVGPDGVIEAFHEKPQDPIEMPGRPGYCLASMGNYIFDADFLVRALQRLADGKSGATDFGKHIIPAHLAERRTYAYDFATNRLPGEPEGKPTYWRDVGTIDAYYEANMDLRAPDPELNLYNVHWPVRTAETPNPPAKFVFDEIGRRGQAVQSVVSEGCIISGGSVSNSVLGRNVFVHSFAQVEDSVIMDGCRIRRHAKVRRAIIDKYVEIPEGETIGYDLERDRQRYMVTDSGIVVIPKQARPTSD